MTEIKEIIKKYKAEQWLFGQYIPVDEKRKYKIMFIGEKPSNYFLRHPEERYLGNYNATNIDKKLRDQIKKYKLGKIYITDMVKTEGHAGADFEKEWHNKINCKKCLVDEIKIVKPRLFVAMSRKTEKLFKSEFPEYENKVIYIRHPAHVVRFRLFNLWNQQFKYLKTKLKLTYGK